jgi:hypothetical protein
MTISATTQGLRPGVCLSTNRPANPFDGQVIYMTDVDQTAVWDGTTWTVLAPIAGGRNAIINGGFDVWQRSVSATTTGADSYASADRWRIRTANGGGSVLSSRQTASLTGFQYCMRFQRVSGNTDTGALQLIQTLETPMSVHLAGRNVTVSFWARSGANYSPTSSAFNVYLQSGTSTDAYWLSFTGSTNLITQTTTLTSTWQKFSFTATAGSTATQFYLQFQMTPTGTAGANDYFEITGVQLEAGAVATPFEQRPIGAELALCQRYYQRTTSTAGDQTFAAGMYLNTTLPLGALVFPVMRAAPTITFNGTYDTVTSGAGLITTGVAAGNITSTTAQLSGTCSGATAGGGTIFRQDSGYFDMSAEL